MRRAAGGEVVFIHSLPFYHEILGAGKTVVGNVCVPGLWYDGKWYRIGEDKYLFVSDFEPRDRREPSPDPVLGTLRTVQRTMPDLFTTEEVERQCVP